MNSWLFIRNYGSQKTVDIFKLLKEKIYQPRILYLAKLSFKSEGEIKIFLDEQKLRELITTRPALQEMLKGVLQGEMKKH